MNSSSREAARGAALRAGHVAGDVRVPLCSFWFTNSLFLLYFLGLEILHPVGDFHKSLQEAQARRLKTNRTEAVSEGGQTSYLRAPGCELLLLTPRQGHSDRGGCSGGLALSALFRAASPRVSEASVCGVRDFSLCSASAARKGARAGPGVCWTQTRCHCFSFPSRHYLRLGPKPQASL